ncbi:DUF3085 domain-containing protein [Ewingella americana]|uniref:DUF3085 domain-containing protein n=1 Tax=Ewingella americana TaxID=41202 RepID=UPI001639DD86|nr:DUF3085 domain-containing protein [Ewingella americana]QMV54165.1 DUF3085 domain-containing protein [Ewingella americana]
MSDLHFKAVSLAAVLSDVTKNACELWLVRDHGIYLTAEIPTAKSDGMRIVAYADGYDPAGPKSGEALFQDMDDVFDDGDTIEILTLGPVMMAFLTEKPTNLTITVMDTGYKYSAKRAR